MVILICSWFYDRQEYKLDDQLFEHVSFMVTKGKDHLHTAISRTVGLPAAIGAKLILQGKINSRGVILPLKKEVYEPIMNELETLGLGLHLIREQNPGTSHSVFLIHPSGAVWNPEVRRA